MRISKFATQLRLFQLRCIYHRLAPPAQETLAHGAHSLRVGKRPPRLWVYLDDDGRVIRTETSVEET
jgi:hypothetical protein